MQGYIPIVFKLPAPKNKNIFKSDALPSFSHNIDYPKFSLGFQHYIHQSVGKMIDIEEAFNDKKKVYHIVEKFEKTIDDYDKDMMTISKKYFDLSSKPEILDDSFFKLWELIFTHDLISTTESKFISTHLLESPGAFLQATMLYRDKFAKKGLPKNDQYHSIVLSKYDDVNKHTKEMDDKFVKYYEREKPTRIIIHKAYPREIARESKFKHDGDITNLKTINLVGGALNKEKANFVTADGGFDWYYKNTTEQEAFKLILSQIITCLKIQATGGNFVCKIYESYTNTTTKLIACLFSFYEEIYITKPLTSRQSEPEKYLICKNFKDTKDNKKNIEILESILSEMNKIEKNLVDFFPEYELDEDLKATIINVNTVIANKEYMAVNEMKLFVDRQNYRGDEYTTRREGQIKASEYWISTFTPDTNNYEKSIKEYSNEIEKIIKSNNDLVFNLLKNIDI